MSANQAHLTQHSLKPAMLVMVIPFTLGAFVVWYVLSGMYGRALSEAGNLRLVTDGWKSAVQAFNNHQPSYERKFAYYKVKDGQTLQSLSEQFGIAPDELTKLNPGQIIPGTTIMVPPVEHALEPSTGPNGVLAATNITYDQGILHVKQSFKAPKATTNIPDLMKLLAPWAAIKQQSPGVYLITKPISVEDNIRLDITGQTVKKLELQSGHFAATCLCSARSEMLIKDTDITSYDPAAKGPDTTAADGRSFVRDLNGRMDVINSQLEYLGSDDHVAQTARTSLDPAFAAVQKNSATYGVSWRISDDTFGSNIATGWVEHSTFDHNYIGGYSYGASGITWKDSRFENNDTYGLNPHNDSDNALIMGNTFDHNGRHGLILTKRSDYNIIKNNVAYDNKLHGIMLHDGSSYNLVSDNLSYHNVDNFVIYNSSFNTLTANQEYSPAASGFRVSNKSADNFITSNVMQGGKHGVYVYDNSTNVLVTGNWIHGSRKALQTQGATNVVFSSNEIDGLSYNIAPQDRLIFGPNTIEKISVTPPAAVLGDHPNSVISWSSIIKLTKSKTVMPGHL